MVSGPREKGQWNRRVGRETRTQEEQLGQSWYLPLVQLRSVYGTTVTAHTGAREGGMQMSALADHQDGHGASSRSWDSWFGAGVLVMARAPL